MLLDNWGLKIATLAVEILQQRLNYKEYLTEEKRNSRQLENPNPTIRYDSNYGATSS